MDLEMKSRQVKFPYTIAYYRSWMERHANTLLKKKATHNPVAYGLDDYKKIEPNLIKSSQTTLWTIDSYERQMKADGVFSIRVLQPLLLRKGKQKELSSLEKDFLVQLDKNIFVDDSTMKMAKKSFYKVLKDKLPEIQKITFGWFFDEYFSQAEDSVMRLYGGTFIDMNEKIATMKANKEFYVDYCHLTPYGNSFLAEQLIEPIDAFMRKKNGN